VLHYYIIMSTINDSKCVLVIGATAGIGRGLALSIAGLPTRPQVVAAGRRQDRLDELAKAKLETVQIDIDTDKETLKKFVDDMIKKYPDVCVNVQTLAFLWWCLITTQLDSVVLCAGIQHEFDFKKPEEIDLKSWTRVDFRCPY